MRIEQIEYALSSSMSIQNKNDNFERFWSLSIRTLLARYKLKRQLKKDLISGAICLHQELLNAITL
jgi:hypothetical protein